MTLGAIILTGGISSRMGRDKAALEWNGRSAVDRLVAVSHAVGAQTVVTAGPTDFGFPFTVEDPPKGGPVAGILSAAAILRGHRRLRALVLAVDAPTVTPSDLTPLVTAPSPGAFYEGLYLPLVVDLAALPQSVGQGWSLRRLIETTGLVSLCRPTEGEVRLRGANTPAERGALLTELLAHEPVQKRGAD